MASANYMMARRATTTTNYRFLVTNDHHQQQTAASELELDESDVWGGSTRSDSPESMPPPSSALRQSRRAPLTNNNRCGGGEPKSMPVNIPDWSKILRDEYKLNRQKTGGLSGDEDDEYDDDTWHSSTERRLPPHEYLARTRMASFSVHEGIGRTLKGRDLKRVRNAIWAKTGFQD